jgi:hypothetical protein
VVLTPVVTVFAHFFLALLTVLWWPFLPGSILLLFPLVVSIILNFFLLDLVIALFFFFISNGAEFGIQLEMALERIESGGHQRNLFIIWGCCSPDSLCLQPVKLELCRCHVGLVSDGDKFTIKIILVLSVNVRLEVVAGDNKVSFKWDANGVVDGPTPGN